MAGRYPPSWLDELRAKADLVKIVSAYTPLKKNGHRYTGLCPFHNEKTPSFSVDGQKQVYYCFGCKAGGSVIQFVMDIEHLSYQEAVEHLADQLRMPLPEMTRDPAYEKRRSLKERIYLANQTAARLYHQRLWEPDGKPILDYLKNRGLSDAVIRRFGIGAATGFSLTSALMDQGFTKEEIVSAGLALEKNERVFDMFRGRAMFPIIDTYGNVLGFGGRAMGDQMPKYLNTADTVAFNKRYTVFAANLLRKAKNLSRVLLVEGYMDVVALSQFGVGGAAATLGTALTPEQARLMSRFAPEIHIAYDGDAAGQKAILRGLEILEGANIPCKVLYIPDRLDPDEFVRQRGLEAFESLKPVTATEYRMTRLKEQFDLSGEEGRASYAKACADILKNVREPVDLEGYLRKLSVDTGYPREVLLGQIGVAPEKQHTFLPKREGLNKKADLTEPVDRNAATLLSVLATGRLPSGSVTAEEFHDPMMRGLCEGLLSGESAASLMDAQPDEQSRALVSNIFTGILTDEDDETLMRMARQALYNMRKQWLETEIRQLEGQINQLTGQELNEALSRFESLDKRLRELKA